MATTDPVELALGAVAWAVRHPETASAIVAILLGSVQAGRHYRRTGRVPLATLPWRAIRRLGYTARRRWFSYPKPPAEERRVLPDDIDTVRERLGTNSYELEWPFSYHYNGEDINARRYFYAPKADYPHRQVHVRAWDEGDHTSIYAHEEPSAIQHPRVHIRSSEMTPATDWVAEAYLSGGPFDPYEFDGGD